MLPPVEIRLQPGLVPVLKHGSHDQKTHAGKRGSSDLPEGWSKRSDEERVGAAMQQAREDWAKNTPDERLRDIVSGKILRTDEYLGPNGTQITVERKANIPQERLNEQLNAVTDLQRIAPVKNLEIEISDAPFEFQQLPESAKGFVLLGDDKIHLRPSAVTDGVDKSSGTLMPVFSDKPQLYSVVHEYGHVLDRRDAATASLDKANIISSAQTGASRYAVQEEPDRTVGREAFAEAWTGWVGSQGRLAEPFRGRSSFVGYFAEKYGWDAGSADRAPSAGFAKQQRGIILADTFLENGAISQSAREETESAVIKFAAGLVPLLKHLRGKHDQRSHGGGGGSRYEESPAEEDYRRQMENIDYIMGRSPFPPGYSAEGIPPPTVTLRQLGREQVAKVRKRIKKFKEDRERRYLANLTPEKKEKLIAANRAREAKRREELGLPPIVYKSIDPVLPLLYDIFRDVVDNPYVWLALVQDERPLLEIDGDLGAILDDMLDVVAPRGEVFKFAPGLRPVLKHGRHNQKDHAGKGGSAREVQATDNESAWNAVLTDEARALNNREKTFPDRYNPPGQMNYGLKDGATETRVVRQEGPPRLRDYETNTSAGLSMTEATQVDGALGAAVSGYGKPLVPVGAERPPQHVYRVMSNEEFETARSRGYIKSDERMNLAPGEGTVSSLRSTGNFYAPVDGSDYRVVRIKYDDADGWRTDLADNYIKTDERVPFDRVDLFTSPVSQSVRKHLGGKHDQKTHGRGGGSSDGGGEAPGGGKFSAWGDRERELNVAARMGPTRDALMDALYPEDKASMREYWESPEALESMNEVYGVSHEGVSIDGFEVRIDATVESITPPYSDYDALVVEGTLLDGYYGTVIGRFERQFMRDDEGGVKVVHELLEIDEESFQGSGFSKKFNQNAENYYISHGIDTIDVHAALDGGGYTWASSGFDFDSNSFNLRKTRLNLEYRAQTYLDNVVDIPLPVRGQIANLRTRMLFDRSDPDFPTPKEWADIGRLPNATTWPGKVIMKGSNWYGTKKLRPEGARKSRTQQWLEDRARAAEEQAQTFGTGTPNPGVVE